MNIIKNICFFFISLFLIYLKPHYFFLFFFLFFIEYLYFIEYLFIFLTNKKTKIYFCFKIDKFDNENSSILKIWMNISKINAFLRLYVLFSKKKINLWVIIKTLVIVFFNIPFKLIFIIKKIIYIDGDTFNKKILFLYRTLYENNSLLKIEVLNEKIYLNCFTLKELIQKIKIINPKITQIKCFNLLKLLQKQTSGFLEFEKNDTERLQFYMSQIHTQEGIKIPFIHPTYFWSLKLNQFNYLNNNFSIHTTSNVNVDVTVTQIKSSPINDFIKNNAKSSGTVITINPKIVIISESLPIKRIQIESVLIDKKSEISELIGWNLNLKYENYLTEKKIIYKNIISEINIKDKLNQNYAESLVSQLVNNNWSCLQNIENDNNILEEIKVQIND